ncbi:BgTH12-02489 [Blumeria graminis f. sp. triticale]|uniref:BgTH12-02489 n=1 Tax=Blumeria graminis f. sp. triticale TaxID=1689686 RepID=A0A9W4GFV5_BLUGR|nr:BgTH12-02489 [Blumeria graminis f. sp. triticale]
MTLNSSTHRPTSFVITALVTAFWSNSIMFHTHQSWERSDRRGDEDEILACSIAYEPPDFTAASTELTWGLTRGWRASILDDATESSATIDNTIWPGQFIAETLSQVFSSILAEAPIYHEVPPTEWLKRELKWRKPSF